ncbi:MAG: leucyl/phenylalanyl-tRNA--protein transferase [Acidimicrobiales bacterium]
MIRGAHTDPGSEPIEPPPTRWSFPPPDTADPNGLVGAGADLEPGTLLYAYRTGLFPMPLGRTIGWWSPDPRAIIPLSRLKVSKSLRQSCRRYNVTMNRAFEEVITACADPSRPHGWINQPIIDAYTELHRAGWAHSIETWDGDELVGGLYGVAIGAFFAGESMFHRANDASKVALVALVDAMKATGGALLDVQWPTPHLRSLGAVEIDRKDYVELLEAAVARPLAAVWRQPMVFAART